MTYDAEKQWRATLEDTHQYQEKLRLKLDRLIKENRPLKDEEERKELFDLLSHATIGLGNKPVIIRLAETKNIIEIPLFEQFISVLFYYDNVLIDDDFFFELTGKKIPCLVNIATLWKHTRNHLLGVFPDAKAMAIRLSKEREKKEVSDGADIDSF